MNPRPIFLWSQRQLASGGSAFAVGATRPAGLAAGRFCVMSTTGFIRILALWLAFAFTQACDCARAAEPEILGSVQFSNQVHQALLLLAARDSDAYTIVTNCVGRIQEGKQSGMWAYQTPPTYEMSDATAFYSLTWCAATIAHDSFHAKLYHDYQKTHAGKVPDDVWTGATAEQQCMKHQLAVMNHVGAAKSEIDHAKKMADGHYVKDHETWGDYHDRKW